MDSTKEFVRMLESLEYMVDPTTDTLLMHMILFKLDPDSRTWFERTFSTDVIPRLDELLQFLATQARSITSSTTKRNVQRKVLVNQSENSRVVDVTSCISDVKPDVQILLCTALIQVRDIFGVTIRPVDVFWIAEAEASSLITNECIERLGLRKEKRPMCVYHVWAPPIRV
ncbi:DUF1758 domain-containing protein [Trichonephila clavipes]|nr:DUF1758 domain-containing protein [Trichonephila clavipes]